LPVCIEVVSLAFQPNFLEVDVPEGNPDFLIFDFFLKRYSSRSYICGFRVLFLFLASGPHKFGPTTRSKPTNATNKPNKPVNITNNDPINKDRQTRLILAQTNFADIIL
jgi:hypothetical protein